jgi:hypothetical protein
MSVDPRRNSRGHQDQREHHSGTDDSNGATDRDVEDEQNGAHDDQRHADELGAQSRVAEADHRRLELLPAA